MAAASPRAKLLNLISNWNKVTFAMLTPLSASALSSLACPGCGKRMSHGYIAGKAAPLRWTQHDKTYTTFAGFKLRKKTSWFSAPNVEAMRCENCKIGVFRYDY